MLRVEFEEVLPAYWTPVGDTGIEYYVSDLCLTYHKDDPWPIWVADLHARKGKTCYMSVVREEDWNEHTARRVVWEFLYNVERSIARQKAALG